MKCTRDCLIVFWLSIFAMFLISAIKGSSPKPELISLEDVTYQYPQDTIVIKDTIPLADTVKVIKAKKRDIEKDKKQVEFEQYQQRQERFDKNIEEMERQSKLMDSLLRSLDTTKVVR